MFDSAIRNPDRMSPESSASVSSDTQTAAESIPNGTVNPSNDHGGSGSDKSECQSSSESGVSPKTHDADGISSQLNFNNTNKSTSVETAGANDTSIAGTTTGSVTPPTAIPGLPSRLLDEELSRRKKNLRRKHRNSHLGCGTCKKRRIKCDEMLPQCFNCVKGKLHCAYLNLDAPARSALRMAQYNQNMRADPPEELVGSYYKEYQTDSAHGHQALLQMQPVLQQAVTAGQQEYFQAQYMPYQLVPQMVNGAPVAGPSVATAGLVPSVYRPMLLIQQQGQQPGKPTPAQTVMYSLVPLQMISTSQIPQMMYQSQEQIPMHLASKLGLVHMAPLAAMDGLPMMMLKSPENGSGVGYESGSSPTGMPAATHTRGSFSGAFPNQSMAQIPRLYPPGVTPVIMAPGIAQGGLVHQIPPGAPYQVTMHQQLSPVPQIAQTPLLTLIHHSGQMIGHPAMAGVSVSPMVKPMLTPSGALYYATPLMLSAPVSEVHMAASSASKHEPQVRVKAEFVKSEFTTEFEKEAEKKKRYNTDSPEPINESEKVPSIKMLLS